MILLKNSFFNTLKDNFKIVLNDQQKSAVLHKEGPAIILAVPGAGKTTVLISRTANLILNHHIHPNNILSITFSKASAKDMKERFISIFGQEVGSIASFSTIHSFAYFLIRDFAKDKKLKLNLIEGIDSGINKIQIIKNIYSEVNNSFINEDKLEELLNIIGFVKNMMIKVEDFCEHRNFNIKGFDKIFSNYESYKRKHNLIDFDDMLTMTLDILQNNPSVLNKYRDRYRYIQVDEGQDTSKVQNEIIKLISSPHNNLFVVADDDQSIYGFRGAYPEDLLVFDKKYPKAKVFFMEENYRSTKNIVSVCNSFIKQNKSRYDKSLFTNNQSIEPVTITKLKNQEDQYDYIIDSIKEDMDLSNIAILFRNNLSAISVIDHLNRNNLNFYMKDSKVHFFKHWVVLDILRFFNLAVDDSDISSFEKIYYKMNGYISKLALNYIKTQDSLTSVFDRLLTFDNFKPFQLENIKAIKSNFKKLLKMKPFGAIMFIENDLGYRKYLEDNCKNFGYSFENVNSILGHLKSVSIGVNSIGELLDKLDSLKKSIDNAKYNKNSEAITLSTIHSAKGLEFRKVYMIDLIDGEFPNINSLELSEIGDLKPLEEERRLFYVGMTRAKTHLNLITFNYRNEERVFYSKFMRELEELMGVTRSDDHGIKVGSIVDHKKFGSGVVKDIDGDAILIHFDDGGLKQLSLNLCIEKNLFK
ncbi:ATP-dependent DNA helicase, UvrD/REP family [Gottschalkia acidurici 9a]|uniref:DNA 3'-5' helicase n=1 Tax=Gottschalkia acidurici (strain ATCC 7906 / DSM 604 / BCRC 14475 / CIP 104303 / KCTC 5404 / NCIMB 10678 / 9a) TaxID=1128398 RepID=K0AV08_GOTA9|nr:ATP-dependent DNA helicase, UvrD/REP family [Gottschalkia acidurici 9a]